MNNDKQYDSVLVGYADEPRYNEETNELMSWNVRFKDTELQALQIFDTLDVNRDGFLTSLELYSRLCDFGRTCWVTVIA